MKVPFITLVAIGLLFLSACQSEIQEKSDYVQIKVGIPDLPKPSMLSEIIKKVHIVPLETREECLMNFPIQLEIHDDLIYLMMASHDKAVLVFNMEGKFQHAIGKKGKGPGEFTELQFFSVLPGANRIYLNDRGGRKTIEFDLKGNFIRDIKTPIRMADIRFINPNKYYLHYPWESYLRLIDITRSEIKQFIPYVNGYNGYGPAIKTQADGSYLYSPTFHDSIYSLEEDTILIQYAFDFGQYKFSGEDQMAEKAKTGKENYPPKKIGLKGPYYELGNLFHFSLWVDDRDKQYNMYPSLWDKKNQTMIRLDDNSDDILFGSTYDITSVSPDGEWISAQLAYELIESRDKIAQNTSFKYPAELLQQIDKLKEDDNPVLVFYKMK